MARLFPPANGKRPPLPEGASPLLVIGLVGGEASGPHAFTNRLVELPAFRVPGVGKAGSSSEPWKTSRTAQIRRFWKPSFNGFLFV